MFMFFGTGALGIYAGLYLSPGQMVLTIIGVTQLCLGGLFGWLFLTQQPQTKEERRRRRKK